MTHLAHIADLVVNRPLLVLPHKVDLLRMMLGGRLGLGEMRAEVQPRGDVLPAGAEAVLLNGPQGSRFVGTPIDEDAKTGKKSYMPFRRTSDGVGIITITGSLVNRGAWVGANSGLTSYEGIGFQIDSAVADPKTKAILLDIESPGGQATGAFETAAKVRAAAAKKPLVASVNGMAASAAYAIASGASRVYTTPTGISGSIGVVLAHADFSRALDREGITVTLIYAGEHKVDGNPYEPLPKTVAADLKAEIDAIYDAFVSTVASGRRRMSEKAVRATQARIFTGKTAVEAGLADDIATFDEVLASLSRAASRF